MRVATSERGLPAKPKNVQTGRRMVKVAVSEEAGLKQKICSVVDVSGGESLMLYRTILGRNLEC